MRGIRASPAALSSHIRNDDALSRAFVAFERRNDIFLHRFITKLFIYNSVNTHAWIRKLAHGCWLRILMRPFSCAEKRSDLPISQLHVYISSYYIRMFHRYSRRAGHGVTRFLLSFYVDVLEQREFAGYLMVVHTR